MSNIPAGYFPQLPDTVASRTLEGHNFCVTGLFGTGIEGHLLTVFVSKGIDTDPSTWTYYERDKPFPTTEAKKAYCLKMGYTAPWRYFGKALHPKAKDWS